MPNRYLVTRHHTSGQRSDVPIARRTKPPCRPCDMYGTTKETVSMNFLASLPTLDQDLASKIVWDQLTARLQAIDGICYYKHPVISSTTNAVPDLTLLARGYE